MKKLFQIFLPFLAAVNGGVGFILRLWQRAYLDEETQLFQRGAPPTAALVVLLCLLAAVLLFLTVRFVRARDTLGLENNQADFGCGENILCMVAGSFLTLVAGALHLLECSRRFPVYQYGVNRLPLMELLTGVLAIPAAAALLLLARGYRRGTPPKGWQAMTTLPAFTALPWLVGFYQDHSRQPEIWLFGLTVLGGSCAAMALYYAAAFSFGLRWRKRCLFFSLMGIVLLVTSLADKPDWTDMAMMCACAILLFGQSCALLTAGAPEMEEREPEQAPDK